MNLIIVDRDALDVDAVLGAWRQVPQGRANFLHIDVGPGCVAIKICFDRFVRLHLEQRKSNQNMYSRGGQAFLLKFIREIALQAAKNYLLLVFTYIKAQMMPI